MPGLFESRMHFADLFSFLDCGERIWGRGGMERKEQRLMGVMPVSAGCAVAFLSSDHELCRGVS